MKLRRIRKNARYAFAYGCSLRQFKGIVRSSPDNNIKRIPARQLKRLMIAARGWEYEKVIMFAYRYGAKS